jgi:prevent-host-death family protein
MRTEIVTTLKRKATKIITDLNKTREPILITQHGKPSAYLIDADDYDLMQKRMQILEGIARGELAISENRLSSHTEAKRKMKKWLN